MKVVVLNGALGGAEGNTQLCLDRAIGVLHQRKIETEIIILAEKHHLSLVVDKLVDADGYLIGTGTYWDSWGSPLQRLFEDLAGLDSTDALFGKPAGLIVTCHAVGAKAVLNRLQGVLNTMGIWIPPHGAMLYSMLAQEALKHMEGWKNDETWKPEDIDAVASNLATAVLLARPLWTAWPVSTAADEPFRSRWVDR